MDLQDDPDQPVKIKTKKFVSSFLDLEGEPHFIRKKPQLNFKQTLIDNWKKKQAPKSELITSITVTPDVLNAEDKQYHQQQQQLQVR